MLAIKYFAYGSNMNHQQMNERCPGNRFLGPAELKGYKLVFDGYSKRGGGAVANIIKSSEDVVLGGLFEISAANLATLDSYEGYPSFYNRKKISVFQKGKEVLDVVVYFRIGRKIGRPNEEYRRSILQGAVDCNLPKEYITYIQDL